MMNLLKQSCGEWHIFLTLEFQQAPAQRLDVSWFSEIVQAAQSPVSALIS